LHQVLSGRDYPIALFETTGKRSCPLQHLPAKGSAMKALMVCIAILSIPYPLRGSATGYQIKIPAIESGPGYDLTPMWDAPFPYRGVIEHEARAAVVPEWILAGVIAYESGYVETARNRNSNGTNDLGIAQLNDKYLAYFADRFNDGQKVDPFNPLVSIRVAARYLAANHELFGDWQYAVAAYNCGPERAKFRPWPQTTERYVKEVFR
jgi:soluble lytic murein transglycosylase-like protein